MPLRQVIPVESRSHQLLALFSIADIRSYRSTVRSPPNNIGRRRYLLYLVSVTDVPIAQCLGTFRAIRTTLITLHRHGITDVDCRPLTSLNTEQGQSATVPWDYRTHQEHNTWGCTKILMPELHRTRANTSPFRSCHPIPTRIILSAYILGSAIKIRIRHEDCMVERQVSDINVSYLLGPSLVSFICDCLILPFSCCLGSIYQPHLM